MWNDSESVQIRKYGRLFLLYKYGIAFIYIHIAMEFLIKFVLMTNPSNVRYNISAREIFFTYFLKKLRRRHVSIAHTTN